MTECDPCKRIGDGNNSESAEHDCQAFNRYGDAEQLVKASDNPIGKRRFIEAGLVVEAGAYKVRRLGHLTRSLGVKGFVGVPQRRGTEANEVGRSGDRE